MLGEPDICDNDAEPKPWSSDEIERERDAGDDEPLFAVEDIFCGVGAAECWWIVAVEMVTADGGGMVVCDWFSQKPLKVFNFRLNNFMFIIFIKMIEMNESLLLFCLEYIYIFF